MKKKSIKAIANYEIIEIIQDLPEWTLYKAFDNDSKKLIFLKLYLPTLKWTDEILNEFFDRVSYLKFIEHEYLLPILDFGKHNKIPYIIFPESPGNFLDAYLTNLVSEQDFLSLFTKIAQALNFLHTQDVVHGLLSPTSILVNHEHQPRLLDHGLGEILKKVMLENMHENIQNLAISNAKFVSPEQIMGRTPSRLSDIYAFGIVVYLGVFGKLPFDDSTIPDTALFHLDPKSNWFRNKTSNLSAKAYNFICKCLATQAEDRFKSFAEILKVLEHMSKRKGHVQPTRSGPRSEPHKFQSTWRYLGLIVLVAIGSVVLWNSFGTFASAPITATLTEESASIKVSPSPQVTATQAIPPTATVVKQDNTPPAAPILQSNPKPYKPSIEKKKINASRQVITLTNLTEIKELSRLGYGRPEDIAASPGQNLYAIASSAGVFIFKYPTSELITWIDPGEWATGVRFSSDGTLLGIGLLSGEIQVWDWQNESKSFTLSGHSGKISKIVFSNNDRFLYSASYDQNIIVWDLNTQQSLRTIRAHSGPVKEIAVANDGRTLASGSSDQVVRIWDISSGQRIHEFPFPGKVEAIAISSDGEYIAVGGDIGLIRQWNIKSKQLRTDPIPVKKRIFALEYLDDDSLFAGLENGETTLFNPKKLKYSGISLDFNIPSVDAALIEIFGTQFEFDTGYASFGSTTDTISIHWNGNVARGSQNVWLPNYDIHDKLTFSPDGSLLASSGQRGITHVWNIPGNSLIYHDNLSLPPGNPFSPDNATVTLVVPRPVGSAMIADKYTLINVKSKKRTNLSNIVPDGTVSFARSGSILVSGTLNSSKLWDSESGYELYYKSRRDSGCWVTTSANNEEILQVNSAAGVFSTWDEKVKAICAKSFAFSNSLIGVSDNLELLVYIESNGFIEGYNPAENRVLWRFKPLEKITALAISPDGSIIILGSQSGKLIFIDANNGQSVFETTGSYGELRVIKFSPQKNLVATTGTDGTVRLFGIPSTP